MSEKRAYLSFRRWLSIILILLVALIPSAGVSLVLGPAKLDLRKALDKNIEPNPDRDLLRLRVPRMLCAGLAGSALSIAGASFQALLRNPLADPYILGVAGGASLGAVLAIVLGLSLSFMGISSVPFFAFIGALSAIVVVYWSARTGGTISPHTLLMCGVIVNASCGAFIIILSYIAPGPRLVEVVSWLVGGIRTETTLSAVLISSTLVVPSAFVLYWLARAYNVMSFGEETSTQLGINVERTKILTFIFASLITAAVVAETGPIGFVGLIVPHIVRLITGPDHRVLLPACFLGGASFLLITDAIAHLKSMPVGAITALCGGPFFLILLRAQGKRSGI